MHPALQWVIENETIAQVSHNLTILDHTIFLCPLLQLTAFRHIASSPLSTDSFMMIHLSRQWEQHENFILISFSSTAFEHNRVPSHFWMVENVLKSSTKMRKLWEMLCVVYVNDIQHYSNLISVILGMSCLVSYSLNVLYTEDVQSKVWTHFIEFVLHLLT